MPVKDPKAYAALSAEIAACETELGMFAGVFGTSTRYTGSTILVDALIAKREEEYSKLQSYRKESRGLHKAVWTDTDRISVLEDLMSVQAKFVRDIDNLLTTRGHDVSTLPK